MGKRSFWTAAAMVIALASPSMAADKYEAGANNSDDTHDSLNTLGHGEFQDHDLDEAGGGEDFDWMVVPTIARHSYEARISGSTVSWSWGACMTCAQFERVDYGGVVLTEDIATVNETGSSNITESYDRSVRWIATESVHDEFIRVRGTTSATETANDVYRIRFWDTTYALPRWNTASGQVTVLLIQNMTQVAVSGQIDFHNAAGTLLHTQAFTAPARGSYALNTATIGALAGQAGHAFVAHTAGYGGLAGKSVALDPATGFSFDTPMVPIPH